MNAELAPTRFAPGSTLDGGKYRIVRQLGAGGMGAVFEAENTLTRKRVAIKCLHPGRAASAAASARLLREAEAASRIRHPNVVDVYDVGQDSDSVFLVMEYLEGEPLSQLLARGEMPVHALISLLLPAMRAVAEAHRQGVVHRDIKPDNIFLAREADTDRPVPKVLDFGISKVLAHEHEQVALTLSGSTLGTPRYMAYEQLVSDKAIDGRVDVYAFGVILYEALTGRFPFEAETFPELIMKIASGELTAPKLLRSELPTTLDRLVCWALERERDRRISSMTELIRELEPFATPRGLAAEITIAGRVGESLSATAFNSTVRSKPGDSKGAPMVPKPSRRWRAVAVAAACVGAAALAWSLLQRDVQKDATQPAAAAVPERQLPAPAESPVPREVLPTHGETLAAPAATQATFPAAVNRSEKRNDKRSGAETKRPLTSSTSTGNTTRGPSAAAPQPGAAHGSTIETAPASLDRGAQSSDKPALVAAEAERSAASAAPSAAAAPITTEAPQSPAPSTFRVKVPQSKDF